jgi:hypothetical protein
MKADGVAQVVEHLASKHDALNLNSSSAKNQKTIQEKEVSWTSRQKQASNF